MRKQIYVNENKKTVVVVLSNEGNGIVAKGRAICHETDVFDKDLGINIANTRAWLQYYNKLSKYTNKELDWVLDVVKHWQDEINRLEQVKTTIKEKTNSIQQEYEELLKNI